jgi:hypothetical protein
LTVKGSDVLYQSFIARSLLYNRLVSRKVGSMPMEGRPAAARWLAFRPVRWYTASRRIDSKASSVHAGTRVPAKREEQAAPDGL